MKIELMHSSPLWVCSKSIRTCWDSHDKSDTDTTTDEIGVKDKELIERIGNKMKHESVKNHLIVVAKLDKEALDIVSNNNFFTITGNIASYSLSAVQNLDIPIEDKKRFVPDEWHYLISY